MRYTFNTIIMNYLDDIENVRNIYIKFCEHMETHPKRDEFIKHIITPYKKHISYDRTVRYVSFNIKLSQLGKFSSLIREIFNTFVTLYINDINPHLIIYNEEFTKHKFNYELFRKEYDDFEMNNNIPCLK